MTALAQDRVDYALRFLGMERTTHELNDEVDHFLTSNMEMSNRHLKEHYHHFSQAL